MVQAVADYEQTNWQDWQKECGKNPRLITIFFETSKIFFMKRIQLDKVSKLLSKLFLTPLSKTLIINRVLGINL